METTNLDDLELELRKLPGVRSAGFTDRDDLLLVQVQVSGDQPTPNLPQQAARIAYRHADKPVAIEVVRWRTIEVAAPSVAPLPTAGTDPAAQGAGINTASEIAPERAITVDGPGPDDTADAPQARVRLLAVLTFPDTDELEVHLTFLGRRIIGRAAASAGVAGAAIATLVGLRNFVPDLSAELAWAEELTQHNVEDAVVVACAIDTDGGRRQGIATGASRIEAAARATLHALNRSLEDRADSPS